MDLLSFEEREERVLGLQLLTISDVLVFRYRSTKFSPSFRAGEVRPTQREFLSFIMSILDPLGLLPPFTVRARILMQDVWASEIKWDQLLRDNEFRQWQLWLEDFREVEKCEIPCCYFPFFMHLRSIKQHIFYDASKKAFSAVSYWRFLLKGGVIHTAMIAAKRRVAALKRCPIPRLELQAAVLAMRLARMIVSEHEFIIERRVFWSDSTTVLNWIRTEPLSYKTFVMNRLGEIGRKSEISEWRWVDSGNNPADDATKLSPNAMLSGSRWFLGPPFLRESEESWPVERDTSNFNDDSGELKSGKRENLFGQTFSLSHLNDRSCLLPDSSRFSSYSRLMGATMLVFKATDRWLEISDSRSDLERRSHAEREWFREVQSKFFDNEVGLIENSKPLPRKSRIESFSPFIDEHGLVRVGSRVERFPDNLGKFQPIILDAKHPVV